MCSYSGDIFHYFKQSQSVHLLENTVLVRGPRFPLLKTITGSHFPKVNYSLGCPASPHTILSHLGAVQQCCLPGDPCLSLNTSLCFYLLSILTLFSHCTNSFHPFFYAFMSANPLQHLVYRNLSDVPLGG